MTPKEKAFELAHKFRLLEIRTSENSHMMISMADAKQCALITVGEMIEMLKELERVGFLKPNSAIPIIEEVKKEIETL